MLPNQDPPHRRKVRCALTKGALRAPIRIRLADARCAARPTQGPPRIAFGLKNAGGPGGFCGPVSGQVAPGGAFGVSCRVRQEELRLGPPVNGGHALGRSTVEVLGRGRFVETTEHLLCA